MKIFSEGFVDPTEPRSIYCDLDGVLANFTVGMTRAYPTLHTAKDVEHFLSAPNIWVDVSKDHPHLFRDLPVLPDAQALMDVLFDLRGRKKIKLRILSATPDGYMPHAILDKRAWVAEHFPGIAPNDIFIVKRRQKQQFAQVMEPEPPAVLIDDYRRNISEWHSAGGVGILHTNTPTTLRKLKVALRTFSRQFI